jgi:hypothetical protein
MFFFSFGNFFYSRAQNSQKHAKNKHTKQSKGANCCKNIREWRKGKIFEGRWREAQRMQNGKINE